VIGLATEHHTFWEGEAATRKLLADYMYGMCDILTCLSEWHSKVKNWPMDPTQRHEWMYLGCKICIMNGDLRCGLSMRSLQLAHLPLGQDFPRELYSMVCSSSKFTKNENEEIQCLSSHNE